MEMNTTTKNWQGFLFLVSGTVHGVDREAPRLQQVGLEALQDHPRGRRLVRPQQRAEGHDHVSQFLNPKK